MIQTRGAPWMGSITLLLVGATAVAVALSARRSEVAVCRETLRGLIDGSQTVGRSINWEQLQAMGVDVGATYRRLANEREQAAYRRAFIAQCAQGFRRARGSADSFRRWRLLTREPGRIIVAADYEAKHKTILVALSDSGTKKVESIQWQ